MQKTQIKLFKHRIDLTGLEGYVEYLGFKDGMHVYAIHNKMQKNKRIISEY